MKDTREGSALYMHCLPADITGVSCEQGEVAATVFDRYRDALYQEASYKPYIIAAMIFLVAHRLSRRRPATPAGQCACPGRLTGC